MLVFFYSLQECQAQREKYRASVAWEHFTRSPPHIIRYYVCYSLRGIVISQRIMSATHSGILLYHRAFICLLLTQGRLAAARWRREGVGRARTRQDGIWVVAQTWAPLGVQCRYHSLSSPAEPCDVRV